MHNNSLQVIKCFQIERSPSTQKNRCQNFTQTLSLTPERIASLKTAIKLNIKASELRVSVTATAKLTLLSRNATFLAVKFVSQAGVSSYEIRARSPVKGAFTYACDAQTQLCKLTGLPLGTDFTLRLQTCEAPRLFKLCYLRAIEFETYTPVKG